MLLFLLIGFHAKNRPEEDDSTPLSRSEDAVGVGAAPEAAAGDGGADPPLPAPADKPLNGGMGAMPPPARASRARPRAQHAPRPGGARQPRGPPHADDDDHDSATRTATTDTQRTRATTTR